MEKMVKKTIELDVSAIKKARRIFDAKTDKEAVNKALQLIAREDDIIKTHNSLAGKAKIDSPFS